MTQDIVKELAANGTLRAAINMSNPLLVTGGRDSGDPIGVSPDMARAVAERLGVAIEYVKFPNPGAVADAIGDDAWDIGLIGAEPARAKTIAFSKAYTEIEATYLVPEGSSLTAIDQVDRPGIRIAVSDRSAYDLYLTRTLQHAELHRAKGLAGALELYTSGNFDALAGLRPALNEDILKLPGAKILDGYYATVQQAIGTKPENKAAIPFLEAFVKEARESGLVAELIKRHGVEGRLIVASGY
ncbi:MAG: transporter substrate-binding domain-containing protein [Rhodospirillaceae bacterium]|jgi:polar amino acid transport system substrate-binding protein|nr:transporter substrate-binding domain-containing protein [Rhodospirillaceae bacterium]MBT4043176.1 transporter substrate-binding domain-containing protein [Rhodospirillaceae bacterium]MBT4688045.1 transporter substrate-binding domain-containing protein [Rhodospirillaceae bacterium]MBT5083335.1 transporter substrate-binding domain-containing protein [Rhodospirillaceae bacterium]MBT5526227.1 transporter substrate-binding domain-containing protein [Rhodospirillaceae bacterium]